MSKGFLLLAALSGFFAVGFGAFGAHGLKQIATAQSIGTFDLGVDYQFYHTFALIVVAFTSHWIKSSLLDWAGYLFIAGILLFSGSLYLYVLTSIPWLVFVTPFGGGCFLLAWLLLALAIWRDRVVELN